MMKEHFTALRYRPRRLRTTPAMRDLVREQILTVHDLIFPLFIKEGITERQPIAAMPGHDQLPLCALVDEVKTLERLGLQHVILFGIPKEKDAHGFVSCFDDGIVQQAIRCIKKTSPDLQVISDICLCEYTHHGHCGVISEVQQRLDVDNDSTLEILQKQAESHARAGADILAPSGMMDGMVDAIRIALDRSGFTHLPILSYAVKYASSFYGPFRQAAEGAPSSGDRKTYQMDIANGNEALREVALDVAEGADMLMVKPGHTYLDIVYRVKNAHPHLPLGVYHTSGEFAMLKAAAEKGWIDEQRAVEEVLLGMKRAGADFIITYYAKELLHWWGAPKG